MRWINAVLLATLAGCARYEPRPVEERKILEELRAVTLAGAGSPEKTARGAGFDVSDGLSEGEAVSVALVLNPDLATLRAERKVAGSQLLAAGLFPDPEIDAAWLSRSDGTVLEGTLLQWIPFLGERGLRKDQARLRAEEVDAEIAAAEWKHAQEVRTAFVEALAVQESLRIASEGLSLRARTLELLEKRNALGAASLLEVNLAAVDAAGLRGEVRSLEGGWVIARQALNRALGLPPGIDVRLQAGEDPWEARPIRLAIEGMEEAALERRWDIAAAKKEYAQAEKDLEIAVRGQYPKVRVGPGYGKEEGESGWGVGASLELPVWNANRGEIAQKTAERDRLALAFRAQLSGLRADLAAAATELGRQEALLRQFDVEIRPRLEQCLTLAQEAIAAGKADFASLVLVQDRVLAVRRDHLAARLAYRKAWIRLAGVLGADPEEVEKGIRGGRR